MLIDEYVSSILSVFIKSTLTYEGFHVKPPEATASFLLRSLISEEGGVASTALLVLITQIPSLNI